MPNYIVCCPDQSNDCQFSIINAPSENDANIFYSRLNPGQTYYLRPIADFMPYPAGHDTLFANYVVKRYLVSADRRRTEYIDHVAVLATDDYDAREAFLHMAETGLLDEDAINLGSAECGWNVYEVTPVPEEIQVRVEVKGADQVMSALDRLRATQTIVAAEDPNIVGYDDEGNPYYDTDTAEGSERAAREDEDG